MKLIYAVYVFFGFINTSLTSCPEGWIAGHYTTNCFYVSEDEWSFDAARKECGVNDGRLLTHHVQGLPYGEIRLLNDIMEPGVDYWIGIICRSSHQQDCKQVSQLLESSADDEVRDRDQYPYCKVTMFGHVWRARALCDSEKRFICQKDRCRDEWTPVPNAATCYKQFNASVTHLQATKECTDHGARLLRWKYLRQISQCTPSIRRNNAIWYWVEEASHSRCRVIARYEQEDLCYHTMSCSEMHSFVCEIDAFTSAATTSSSTITVDATTTPAAATTTTPTEVVDADKSSQNAGISKLGLAVGLPVGLVVVASIIVVLIVVVIRRKKRPAREQGPPMAVDNAVYNVESDHVITSVPKHGGDAAQNESKVSPAGPEDLCTHSQAQHLRSMDSHSPNLKSQSPTYANVAPSRHYENAAMAADATGDMHDDVIMVDNDVYHSADDSEKAGDRSVYCLAEKIPQRQVHEKDSDEVVFEENDVYERSAGIGSADDVDDNIIFEENDMYERTL